MSILFIDEIHDYQFFVVSHFFLLGNSYSIIREQFPVKNAFIDILAYDKYQERLIIIELKTPQATNKAISQIVRYFNYLKDCQLDSYIISDIPECWIIAPTFKKINLPERPIIKLLEFNSEYTSFNDVTYKFYQSSILFTNIKRSRSLLGITPEINLLVQRIITLICMRYNDIKMVEQNNKITILDKATKRIIAKIIIPFNWFTNYIELLLFNIIKDKIIFDAIQMQYDPAIQKVLYYKNFTKLQIKDIPRFLMKG